MGSTIRAVTPSSDSTSDPQSADEIQAAIERSRAEIGQTLEALHGRLNPRVLKEEVLQQFHEGKEAVKAELQEEVHSAKAALAAEFNDIKEQVFTGVKTEVQEAKVALREATLGKVETMIHDTKESMQSASHSLATTIKENPVPAVLVGAGLLWMFAASRAKSHGTDLNVEVGRIAHQAGDAVKGAAHTAGEKVEGFAHDVKESVGQATRATRSELTHWADRVGASGSNMTQRTETMFRQHPLAIGAVVLGLGAILGMAIPITRKEAELMRETRQNLMDRAGDLAADAGTRLKQGTEKVTSEIKKAVQGNEGPETKEA